MSQYTELQPEQAVNPDSPLTPGVPTDVALDGVDADHVHTVNGVTTTATSVNLTDTVNADRLVEIFDGTTSVAIVNVDGNGNWTTTSIAIDQGEHRFTAKARYGSEPISLAWTLTRAPRLTIDTSTLNLQGWNITLASTFSPSWTRTAYQFPNISATRTPSEGTSPYTYTSADPRIAEVGLTTGTVISRATGNTTITVTDQSGQTQSYPVSCNNVVEFINLTTHYSHAQASDVLQRSGYALLPHPTATGPGRELWEGIQQAYSPTARMVYWAWERASPGDAKAPAMEHTGPGSRPTWRMFTPIDMNSPNQSIGYRLKRAGQ